MGPLPGVLPIAAEPAGPAVRLARVLPQTCLCLITRDSPHGPQVLLGLKKRGFGQGRWVGLGGHVEAGETAAQAAVREVAEESGLVVPADSLEHRASIEFRFPARPSWDMTAEVFATAVFEGEPAESDEVVPRWFGTGALPLELMWDDAKHWLPQVLAGQRTGLLVTFAADCATVASLAPAPLPPAGSYS